MAAAIQSQPAFLLHSRPFRDTSLLVDFLTRDHGRVSAVARGVRSLKSKNRALLQPFIPLQVNLTGRHELKTLAQVESVGAMFPLKQKALFAAMYLNELLVRLLQRQDADTDIFNLYQASLRSLCLSAAIEPVLRCFELDLLDLLGYGIDFSLLYELDEAESRSLFFDFHAESGLERVQNSNPEKYYPALDLLNIAAKNFQPQSTQKAAKRLLRTALAAHLGDRALASRTLFQTYMV